MKGFTLLELVLVLLLIGILAVTALPSLESRSVFQLDNAIKKIESDIQYAQSLAITTNEAYGFRTVPGTYNRVYEIYRVRDNSIALSPYDHLPLREDLQIAFPSTGILGSTDVQFNKDGFPVFILGSSPIILLNDQGDSKSISVNSKGLIKQQ